MKVLLATENSGKIREIQAMVGPAVQVVVPTDLGSPSPVVAEDADTFAENARLKAAAYADWSGLPALADDSGLCVDALGGRPGVHSARYAADDEARIQRLLREMAGQANRRARFVCALSLVVPGSSTYAVEGVCEGQIGDVAKGARGFGYDPVFVVDDGRTFAELTPAEKAAVSHRGKALAQMCRIIESLRAPL